MFYFPAPLQVLGPATSEQKYAIVYICKLEGKIVKKYGFIATLMIRANRIFTPPGYCDYREQKKQTKNSSNPVGVLIRDPC